MNVPLSLFKKLLSHLRRVQIMRCGQFLSLSLNCLTPQQQTALSPCCVQRKDTFWASPWKTWHLISQGMIRARLNLRERKPFSYNTKLLIIIFAFKIKSSLWSHNSTFGQLEFGQNSSSPHNVLALCKVFDSLWKFCGAGQAAAVILIWLQSEALSPHLKRAKWGEQENW